VPSRPIPPGRAAPGSGRAVTPVVLRLIPAPPPGRGPPGAPARARRCRSSRGGGGSPWPAARCTPPAPCPVTPVPRGPVRRTVPPHRSRPRLAGARRDRRPGRGRPGRRAGPAPTPVPAVADLARPRHRNLLGDAAPRSPRRARADRRRRYQRPRRAHRPGGATARPVSSAARAKPSNRPGLSRSVTHQRWPRAPDPPYLYRPLMQVVRRGGCDCACLGFWACLVCSLFP
jgi:hypothetical protein